MVARTGQDWGLQSSRRSKTGDRDSLVVDRPPLLADRSCYGAARPACRSDRRRWQLVESAPQAAAMPVNLADFTFVQYPAREQAELRVRIKIPGVWFNGLSGAERSVKYDAEAYDFVDAHVFKNQRQFGPDAMAEDNSSDEEDDEAADEGDADDDAAADAPAAVGAPHA